MKKLLTVFSIVVLAMTIMSCNNGSGGSDPVPPPDPPDWDERVEDLYGTWDYNAQGFTGVMVFNESGTMTSFTNSACSGSQILNPTTFVWHVTAYHVRITNIGYCTDSRVSMQFAVNFTDEYRVIADGLVDVHWRYATDYYNYTRYDMHMEKRKGTGTIPEVGSDVTG